MKTRPAEPPGGVSGQAAAPPRRPAPPLPLISIAASLLFLAILEALALRLTGGVFEYPLDDVYIHLAMGEQIGHGHYGVNPQEPAAAASSALYPLLLSPLAGDEAQRWLPLLWNIAGLVLTAWLWGKLLLEAGWGRDPLRRWGLALAALGPLAVLSVSVSFLGMEHSLHAAATLSLLYGLLRHLKGDPAPLYLLAGALFAPLLRFEGLALALLTALALAASGARRMGLAVAALAVLPVLGFMGFLVWLGLEPLPSSISAKLLVHEELDLNLMQRMAGTFWLNLSKSSGRVILGFSLLILALAGPRLRAQRLGLLVPVLVFSGLAHLLLGQVGWLQRYEHYIIALLAAGLMVLIPTALGGRSAAVRGGAALAVLALLLGRYLPETLRDFPYTSRAIMLQQRQMARFAQDFLKAPVAVNDLGAVSWRNPCYVLDLWGLASAEARRLRIYEPHPGWAGELTARHGVPVAMIYDEWLGDAVPPGWIRLGWLVLNERRGFLGSDRVAFYATTPEAVPAALAALKRWVPGLHPLSHFDHAPGMP